MTKRTLEKLPTPIRYYVDVLKHEYKSKWFNNYQHENITGRIDGYLRGLKDCGIITESEWRALYCYITL